MELDVTTEGFEISIHDLPDGSTIEQYRFYDQGALLWCYATERGGFLLQFGEFDETNRLRLNDKPSRRFLTKDGAMRNLKRWLKEKR